MRTRTNYNKYGNKWDVHTVDESGTAVVRDEKEIKRQNAIKDVCLNCTKKKCRGSEKCFERERNKK